MLKEGMTISEATREWVGEFNQFPYDMLMRLFQQNCDEWHEVTKPSVGDQVDVYNWPETDKDGNKYTHDGFGVCEIVDIEKTVDEDDEDNITYMYIVSTDEDVEIRVSEEDFDLYTESFFPMWGTLWQFGDSCDDYWLEELNGLHLMSQCGFRIYEHDEWGYFFGIDGAGYDFYEAHWIPLYKARGLKWHDSATEEKAKE